MALWFCLFLPPGCSAHYPIRVLVHYLHPHHYTRSVRALHFNVRFHTTVPPPFAACPAFPVGLTFPFTRSYDLHLPPCPYHVHVPTPQLLYLLGSRIFPVTTLSGYTFVGQVACVCSSTHTYRVVTGCRPTWVHYLFTGRPSFYGSAAYHTIHIACLPVRVVPDTYTTTGWFHTVFAAARACTRWRHLRRSLPVSAHFTRDWRSDGCGWRSWSFAADHRVERCTVSSRISLTCHQTAITYNVARINNIFLPPHLPPTSRTQRRGLCSKRNDAAMLRQNRRV